MKNIYALLQSCFSLLMVCGLLSTTSATAQLFPTTVTIEPATISVTDTILIITSATMGSGGCWLQDSTTSISGSDIHIAGFYCSGLLTVICTSTDTFKVGPLAAGTYSVNFSRSDDATGGCMGAYTFYDSVATSFTVGTLEAADMEPELSKEGFKVFEDQFSWQLKVQSEQEFQPGSSLKIFDAQGKAMDQIRLPAGEKSLSILPGWPTGIYFYRVESEGKAPVNGKFLFLGL